MTTIFNNKRKFNNPGNEQDKKLGQKSSLQKSSVQTVSNVFKNIDSLPYNTELLKITPILEILKFFQIQNFKIETLLEWDTSIQMSIEQEQTKLLVIRSSIPLYLVRSRNFLVHCMIDENLQINKNNNPIALLFLRKGKYYITSDACTQSNYLEIEIV